MNRQYRVRLVMGALFISLSTSACADNAQQPNWRTKASNWAHKIPFAKLGHELKHIGAIVGLYTGAAATFGLAHNCAAKVFPSRFTGGIFADSCYFGICSGLGLAAASRIGGHKLPATKLKRLVGLGAGVMCGAAGLTALCTKQVGPRQQAITAVVTSMALIAATLVHRRDLARKKKNTHVLTPDAACAAEQPTTNQTLAAD